MAPAKLALWELLCFFKCEDNNKDRLGRLPSDPMLTRVLDFLECVYRSQQGDF